MLMLIVFCRNIDAASFASYVPGIFSFWFYRSTGVPLNLKPLLILLLAIFLKKEIFKCFYFFSLVWFLRKQLSSYTLWKNSILCYEVIPLLCLQPWWRLDPWRRGAQGTGLLRTGFVHVYIKISAILLP